MSRLRSNCQIGHARWSYPTSIRCFRKQWYPQIIHFDRVFHYKPSILGYPIFGNPYQPIPSSREFMAPFSAWGLESSNLGWSTNRATKWRHGTTQFRQKDPGAEVCRKFEGPKITQLWFAHKCHILIHPIPSNSLKQSAICDTNSYETERDCAGNGLAKHWWPGKILHHKCAASRLLVGFPEVFQTEYQFLWKLHTCWQKVSLSLSVKWGWVWLDNAMGQAEMLSALDYYNAGFISEANSCELWMFDMFETPPYISIYKHIQKLCWKMFKECV